MRLALVALGLVACGQAPDAPPISAPPTPADARLETRASAIKDGYNDATSTNVVGMVSLSGWGIGICSGSLIAPNVVLTARHCVAPVLGEAENGGVDCTKTYFGDPSPAVGLYITTDQEMGRHGNYTAALEIRVPEDTAFCGNDVALVILDSAIPSDIAMPLVPRVDLPVLDKLSGSIPDAYSAVGYGEADDGQGDSGRRRRRDGLTAFCWDTNCPWYSSVTGGEWGGEAGVCQGDSGGPAIDALNRVIGVASRGNGGCANPVYTGVHVWADLIKKTALDAAAIGGYTAPAWATGWPTDPGFSYTVGIACAAPEECASGVCYRGYCTRFCSAEAPCDDPFSCSIDQGFCTTRDAGAACIGDSDCGGSPCISGVCSRGCNGSVLRCPGGFQCAAVDGRTAPAFTNGFCVPAAVGVFCGSDADCPGGACAQGTCTRACSASFGCPIAWHCDGAVAQCSPISIGGACSNDDSCAGGSCVDGACTRGCSVSSPCPATHACDTQTGFCQRVPYGLECAGDGQCDLGVCISGRCTAGCSEAGQCISGYTCDSSQKACLLIPAGDLCGSDGDCAGGLCEQGRCTRSCSAAAPCGEGTFCEEQSGKCLIPKEDVAAATCTAGTHGETSSGWMALLLVLGLGVTRRRVAVNQPG